MVKKYIRLLMILLGVVILLAGYLTVYQPYTEKAETVNSEREALLPELTELQGYRDNLDAYYTGIEDSQKTIKEETARYADDVRNEDLIMFAAELRDSTKAAVNGVAFTGNEELLAYADLAEDGSETGTVSHVWKNGMTLNLDMSYEQMRAVIDHVNAAAPRTSLESLTIAYAGETGSLSGVVTINKYFIAGSDYVYEPTYVPGISVGTENLFGTVDAPEETPEGAPEDGVVVLD